MYPIDLDTCSLDDVIARSFTCHPTALRDRMRHVAIIHNHSADQMHDREARLAAFDMGKAATDVAKAIEQDQFDIRTLTFGQRIQTFSEACRLQLIPRHIRVSIAERDDAARAA